MKSDNVKKGMQQAPHRSLFNALGFTEEEMQKPLVGIVSSYRYERMLPTIVTTNLSGKAIREKYGDRLADRFNEMMQVVTMPDINFRTPQTE